LLDRLLRHVWLATGCTAVCSDADTHTHVYSTITTYNLEEASTHMNEKHMLAVFLVPRDLDI